MERTRKPWNKTCETAGSTLGVAGIYLSTVLLQVFLYYTYKDKYTRTHCELITLFGACNVDISLRSKCFSKALNTILSTPSGFNATFNLYSLFYNDIKIDIPLFNLHTHILYIYGNNSFWKPKEEQHPKELDPRPRMLSSVTAPLLRHPGYC